MPHVSARLKSEAPGHEVVQSWRPPTRRLTDLVVKNPLKTKILVPYKKKIDK